MGEREEGEERQDFFHRILNATSLGVTSPWPVQQDMTLYLPLLHGGKIPFKNQPIFLRVRY